jgi:predicted outer membrane protein
VKRIVGLIAAFMLTGGATVGAQTSDSALAPAAAAPVDAERAAVATIVMNAVTQVKLCALATEKSTNGDVKTLCRKVSTDNARTALAGMQLARTLGASEVKFEPQPDTSEVLDSLLQYSGSEFDRQFLLGQIESDETDENSVRYAAEFASDPAVHRYESGVLPSVEQHLLLAETALRRLSEATP